VFFAPRDNPQIAGVIFAEHGEHGSSAAPIAKHAMETFFAKKEGRPLPPPLKPQAPTTPPVVDEPRIAGQQGSPGSQGAQGSTGAEGSQGSAPGARVPDGLPATPPDRGALVSPANPVNPVNPMNPVNPFHLLNFLNLVNPLNS
jgi:hypothetical protein